MIPPKADKQGVSMLLRRLASGVCGTIFAISLAASVTHAQGIGTSVPEHDEGEWEGPSLEDFDRPDDFAGISLVDLEEQGEFDLQPRHSGYTLVQVSDTPANKPLPYVKRAMDKLLLAAQAAYLNVHREGGRLGPAGETLLKEVGSGPDRFLDGRSSYALIVKGTVDEIVTALLRNGEFPEDTIRASLRVSTVSHAYPQLPFAMHLSQPPALLSVQPRSIDLKNSVAQSYVWFENSQYPFIVPALKEFSPSQHSKAQNFGGNEVKSFMVKREMGDSKTRDWMPYLFQSLETQSILNRTGYFLNSISGEIRREGDPVISTWDSRHALPVLPDYHFAEVLTTKHAFEQFLRSGRSQGLLKMYLGYGFQIEMDSVQVLSKYDDLMVIPMRIKRADWLTAVVGTEGRRGQSTIAQTRTVTRTFPGVAKRLGLAPKDESCREALNN